VSVALISSVIPRRLVPRFVPAGYGFFTSADHHFSFRRVSLLVLLRYLPFLSTSVTLEKCSLSSPRLLTSHVSREVSFLVGGYVFLWLQIKPSIVSELILPYGKP